MKLKEILKGIDVLKSFGDLSLEVKDIAYDSRKIKGGEVFVAIKGTKLDGHSFIDDAIRKGASAIVVEEIPEDIKVTTVQVKDTREALSKMAKNLFRPHFEKMKIIGITGTNGKTTTSYLLESVIRQTGEETALIGTIKYRFSGKEIPATVTTPESVDLMRLLKEISEKGIRYVVMEVTSHSLSQGRVRDCPFEVAVFTNITRDHLDYHGSMENYFKEKQKLFLEYNPEISVINSDDPMGRKIAEKLKRCITYGIDTGIVRAKEIKIGWDGIRAKVVTPKGLLNISSELIGRFNLYNILACSAAAYALGIENEKIEEGIRRLRSVPGRMEIIKKDPAVIIDYAHTPDALKKVIETLREISGKRIITVFGCGGERDKGKRPVMGYIAAKMSDVVIVTSDNPRREDPLEIIKQIEEGIKKTGRDYIVEVDRRKAIEKAILIAEKDDIVLIAGKGHEQYQIIGEERIPFSDKKIAEKVLYAKSKGSL